MYDQLIINAYRRLQERQNLYNKTVKYGCNNCAEEFTQDEVHYNSMFEPICPDCGSEDFNVL